MLGLSESHPWAIQPGGGARLALRDGRGPGWLGRDVHLDVSRLREDTGFRPGYDTPAAVAGYIGWLRSGNDR